MVTVVGNLCRFHMLTLFIQVTSLLGSDIRHRFLLFPTTSNFASLSLGRDIWTLKKKVGKEVLGDLASPEIPARKKSNVRLFGFKNLYDT